MSYKGDLSQLWQNRAFCDKFCDKTVAQNCIRCDKVINISGWRKKTALLQSSEMCHDKVIFSPLKTRLFYLETFQFHLLFPALISEHFTIYFYHFGQVFSLIGISNTWTRPDKQLIFFLQPEYFFTLNSEIQQRIDSQSRKFENCERLMRKHCFPRLFSLSPHCDYRGRMALDIANFRLQDSPTSALIWPISLNYTISL